MRGNIILSLILLFIVINLSYTGKAFGQTPTGRDSISLNVVPGGTYGYLNVNIWIMRTGSVSWNLGNSSLVFHYNNVGLSNPTLIQTGIGNGGNYNATSIHSYGAGYEGIDITLPIQFGGTIVPTSYTLVGTVQFQITNPSSGYQVYWNNIYTSVSADDWLTYPIMTNINPPTLNLNITALLQGFYDGATMVPDNVTVQLRNSTAPYTMVEQRTVLLNSSGNGTLPYETALTGTPYYIVLRFDNGVETWSASPQTFSGSTLSYDFTTAATQAYGNNTILKGTKWCVYSGDVNQDGLVDFSDLALVDNDNINFVTGATLTDLNGDLSVDFSDIAICDNNNINFIRAVKPPGAPALKSENTNRQIQSVGKYKKRIEKLIDRNDKIKK